MAHVSEFRCVKFSLFMYVWCVRLVEECVGLEEDMERVEGMEERVLDYIVMGGDCRSCDGWKIHEGFLK